MDQKSEKFWAKADQLMVMVTGGMALGTAISSHIPGTIIGGLFAIGSWYYINRRQPNQ